MSRRRGAGQGGFTLVEVLVSLVIAGLIIGPVSAWAVSTFRHQGVGKDELGRATATGLLNSYYVRDVASARQVAVNNPSAISNCGGLPTPAPPETVVLRLTRSGSAGGWIVYSEVRPTPTTAELWRRVCGPDGSLVDSTVVFDRVVPGTVRTGCPEPGGTACATNRKVSLRLTPAVAAGISPRPPITISAVRRTDAGSVGLATSSPPDPLIEANPARGYRNTQFVLRDASTDPDNDIASRFWTLPSGAALAAGTTASQQITVVFPSGQTGPVKLTVTDGTGSSVATEISIEILNRNPAAAASCAVGGDPRTMVLSAAGSSDPDGSGGLTFQWTTPDGTSLSGDPATWVVPVTISGPQLVTLLVTSASGAQSTAFTECPVPAPENPVGGVAITPEPITGLKPVAHLNVPAGATLDVTFSAQPAVPDPAGYALALFRQGASSPTRTSPADTTTWTVPFGGADTGVWEVALVRGGVEGPRRTFRINASPRIDVVSADPVQVGDFPARLVTFTSADSDADGTIVSRTWDFGDGTTAVDPGTTFDHAYAAPGTYAVTLTVTDDDGASTSETIQVLVAAGGG